MTPLAAMLPGEGPGCRAARLALARQAAEGVQPHAGPCRGQVRRQDKD
jgi:hypothetical protein